MFKNKFCSALVTFGVLAVLNGCASISTEIVCSKVEKSCDSDETITDRGLTYYRPKISTADGITYYLPRRDIRINFSIKEEKPDSAASTPAKNASVTAAAASGQDINIAIRTAAPKCPVTKKSADKQTCKTQESTSQPASSPKENKPETKKTVTVTVANNYISDIIPDVENVFLLHYNKNYIANNNMSVGVNSMGLLSVTHADTVNKINEIAANIGADVAMASYGAGFIPQANSDPRKALTTTPIDKPGSVALEDRSVSYTSNQCELNEGEYSILVNPKQEFLKKKNCREKPDANGCKIEIPICKGVTVKISRLFVDSHLHDSFRIKPVDIWDETYNRFTQMRNFLDITHLHNKFGGNYYPGLFYKQDLPYSISVYNFDYQSNKLNSISERYQSQFIAFSPNESPVYFAPITQTLFTDNTSDITLVNGVVNTLQENTDSELQALTQIPANVLGGYTSAVGKVFSSMTDVIKNKGTITTTAQSNELAILVGAEKIKRCQMAIANNDTKDKTGDDLTKALNNIQTACGN
ncbi:MAG: hypothetical protein M0Q44_20870 [Methylobacter sp.]|jgi:hypothetical protein|nr:hypothetical protein [Methylobacter sp.]